MYLVIRYLMFIALALILIGIPTISDANSTVQDSTGTIPENVYVSIFVVDFKRVDVGTGTVGVDFYLHLRSETPLTINDFELMNGIITSTTLINDTTHEKGYRIVAVLTVEPDLSRYPFDNHIIPIRIEPKLRNTQSMVLVNDPTLNGLDSEADLLGWTFTTTDIRITNKTYITGEVPFSRIIFDYGIVRNTTSTVLKFFLPLMLIISVSLSSLLMKISSRLSLNASMFLAAVLIHWRIADAIPVVTYATFLDKFMIITYATLVMVLISGILFFKYKEDNNTVKAELIWYWSLRVIPSISITLFVLLFCSLML